MIVKCSNCHRMLAKKEFELHKCDVQIKSCKIIEVNEIYDGSYEQKKLMNGMGIDGVLYTFEVVSRKAIPITVPLANRTDEFLQRKRTDENFTEPLGEECVTLKTSC
jgi:hypothetical protein